MVKIKTIYTKNLLRNYTYLISDNNQGFWCIDPWEAGEITNYIKKVNGKLLGVINTHEHNDHTRGNEELKKEWDCKIYGLKGIEKFLTVDSTLEESEEISLCKGSFFKVLNTPGHTMCHLCLILFIENKAVGLFSGDTLFNAGVGNCHNGGDPILLFKTISTQILKLNEDIILYPGHDYVENNLNFTLAYDKENIKAYELLKIVQSPGFDNEKFHNSLKHEKEVNLFLRAKDKNEFVKLRELRNNW